ncbi:MAG: YncE family protein [Acidobacteria bacterium]|nr:YncE family protein [Acidobacteriota bacterium]
MGKHKKRIGIGALSALVATSLIILGVGFRSHHPSVVKAEEDTWTTPEAGRLGIRLIETRDASGPPAYDVQAGDLLFFTNAGTSYGSVNTRNSIVVINAKTKRPIAMSDLEPGWSQNFSSHSGGTSPNAWYVYLPAMGFSGTPQPPALLVLDARTLKISQIIRSGGQPHHVKIYQDSQGHDRVLVEDFNWAGLGDFKGAGFYVLDPYSNNQVVGGMSPGDVVGNPYVGQTAPDGKYLYYSMPPPNFRQLIPFIDGALAKINMETWKVEQYIPMHKYPLWTVFSNDGKWAWITNSEDSEVLKIQRGTGPGDLDKVVAEVPTGPGPYGLRMNIDDTELWVADKGETLPGQRGVTLTIIDPQNNKIKETIQTNCITNDHLILSPNGEEMWATCNQSHEIVVLDTRTHKITARIPMPNDGDAHGGSFVWYFNWNNRIEGETVSDQNGLHFSARNAAVQGTPWDAVPNYVYPY